MTAIAITFMLLAMLIIWGTLAVAVVFLTRRPEVAAYPEGGYDQPAGSAG
jgi:hypothetical protein